MKHTELDDFARHAVDLHPVAQANTVFPHQHKPTDEAHNEIFESNREARAREPEKSAKLPRGTENHQKDEEHGNNLHRYASDGVKRLDLAAVHRETADNLVHQRAEVHAYQ